MKKNVTIKEIAMALGVHHATVSRALKGSPLIKEQTRDKIVAKAREMGYSPNLLAQGFRNGRTNTIAIVVPDLKHHYFAKFVSDLTRMAYDKGYMALIFQSNDNFRMEQEILTSLISMRVGGVAVSIGLNTKSAEHFNLLREEEIPTVFFDRIPQETDFSTVSMDNASAVGLTVDELLQRGKKHIAYVSFESHLKVFTDRLHGYETAIERAGLSFRRVVAVRQFFMQDGHDMADALLHEGDVPDAVICVNDEVAIGLMKYLKERNLRIPEDIAVVGFDDNPMGRAFSPELTTLSQSIEQTAEACMNLLLEQIESKQLVKKDIVFPMKLKIRESI